VLYISLLTHFTGEVVRGQPNRDVPSVGSGGRRVGKPANESAESRRRLRGPTLDT